MGHSLLGWMRELGRKVRSSTPQRTRGGWKEREVGEERDGGEERGRTGGAKLGQMGPNWTQVQGCILHFVVALVEWLSRH